MKSYYALAWKELKAQKVTSCLIIIAILLSTMMTTVIGQSIGILKALQVQQAESLNGYRYASFNNISKDSMEALSKDSRLSLTGNNIFLGTTKLKNSGIVLSVNEYDKKSFDSYPKIFKVKSGRLPEKPFEIALSRNTLQLLEYNGKIGDSIHLNLSASTYKDNDAAYKYQGDFILCGVLDNNYLGYSSGVVVGTVGVGTAEKILPEKYRVYSVDFITSTQQNFQQTVFDLADKFKIQREYIVYNWIYLDALGIDYAKSDENKEEAGGFSFMTITAILVCSLVLLAAGLVIYNILKMSVGKRIKEYGCLRAIGAEKKHLYFLVVTQIFILCGIGIPFGALIGVASTEGVIKVITNQLFEPKIFMASSSEELTALIAQNSSGKLLPLLVSVLITLFFAFLAAIPAARYASKVPPTIAMIGSSLKVKRKNRRKKNIKNFEAFYARLNLKRNIGRTTITIVSLVMSITVYIALNAFSGVLDTSKAVQKLHIGDYSITNDKIGLTSSAVDEIRNSDSIASLSTVKYKEYLQNKEGHLDVQTDIKLKQPYETLQIIGVDSERLQKLCPELLDSQKESLTKGTACMIKNPVSMTFDGKTREATFLKIGERVAVQGNSMEVVGYSEAVGLIGKGYTNGVQIIVYDTIFDKLTGESNYTEVYPTLMKNADRNAIEQKIKAICDEIPNSRWISFKDTDKQLDESYQQINILAWVLILFIGLIGLLNIINTTYTNIHTRISEIGIQRAIGMSRTSIYKTFLWEGIYYGIIASIFGSVIGYICTLFVGAVTTDQLTLVMFPVVSILQVTTISIIVCLVATIIPLSKIAKMNIVNSIEIIE